MHINPDKTERPICFVFGVLNCAERKYSVIQGEMLAIYWSIHKCSQYLLGRRFLLFSDHRPFLASFGEHKFIPIMASV